MKKKGLIVATIVMVLVLAVSLTTATYAWFTAEGQTSIESINITAANAGEVLLGLTTTGSYVADANDTSFVSGQITEIKGVGDNTAWVGDPGMNVMVDTGLSLSAIEKAVSTANAAAPELGQPYTGAADAANNQLANTHFIKASGQGATISNSENNYTVEAAGENIDYLHFTIGLLATKANTDTITLTITIQGGTANNGTIMGVTNALHLIYKVNNESTWKNIDIGGTNSHTTKITEHKVYYIGNEKQPAAKDGQVAGSTVIELTFGTEGQAIGTSAENIQQVEIYLYYVGTDDNCVTAGLGTTADVSFAVTNTNNATQQNG